MVKQENGWTDPRVARARQLRRAMTNAERKLWWYLRRLPNENAHFRRQATIGQYYADFACHHHRLVIEVDGPVHAGTQLQDGARDCWLTSRGYRVLRFSAEDVYRKTDDVVGAIYREMCRGTLLPPRRL